MYHSPIGQYSVTLTGPAEYSNWMTVNILLPFALKQTISFLVSGFTATLILGRVQCVAIIDINSARRLVGGNVLNGCLFISIPCSFSIFAKMGEGSVPIISFTET